MLCFIFICFEACCKFFFDLTKQHTKSVLFNFHILVNFPVFLLLLFASFITLCLEKIHGMITIFLNLLWIFLCSNMWSILEKYPHTLGKNMNCGIEWKVSMSLCSTWFIVLLKASVSLLFFCLNVLSIIESEVLMSLTISVLLFLPSVQCSFCYWMQIYL